MAGERRGKLYEFVVGEALRRAYPDRNVRTQVVMENSLVQSDWLVEGTNDSPPILVFVTHSGSETKNTQKFWRDCAELLQALRATSGRLASIGVIFDANLLRQLVDAEASLLDRLILAEEVPGAAALVALTDAAIQHVNARKKDDYNTLVARLTAASRTAITNAVAALATEFTRHKRARSPRAAMAHLLRDSLRVADQLVEPTQFYTGCAALMLVDKDARLDLLATAARNRLPSSLPSYFRELCGVNSIAGDRPTAPLRWLASNMDREIVVAALNREETEKAAIYRAMLRAADHSPAFVAWIRRHGRDPRRIFRLLADSFSAPRAAAERALGCDASDSPPFNWAWTFFVATTRELKNRKQAFGASTVADITGNRRLCIQNSILSDYECGTRDLSERDLTRLSEYFAKELRGAEVPDAGRLRHRLLHEVFVDKIGPHSVHPIPAIIREVARRHGVEFQAEWTATSIGQMSGATGNAARVRVLRLGHLILWWRSAFEGHEADKAKEVGARIFGLTTAWNARTRSLSRLATSRFTLVVDGDFSPDHLAFFQACGADTLLRPQMVAEHLPRMLGG